MSPHPTVVNGRSLDDVIREIVADVLVVPPERVFPESALMADLGAESIDFLDLVFRLEEALDRPIPYPHWQRFVDHHLAGVDITRGITLMTVRQFAEEELRNA